MSKFQGNILVSVFVVLSFFILGGRGVLAQTNIPPVADAGPDVTIAPEDLNQTTIIGYVTDVDNTQNFLQCGWGDGITILTPIMDVGPSGECPLYLGNLALGTGVYTMILYAADFEVLSTDTMVLTINENLPPVADAGPDITITTDEIATTTIMGYVTDVDNTQNFLQCGWGEGTNILVPPMDVGPNGECPLDLSTVSLGSGVYTMILYAADYYVLATDDMVLTIVQPNSPPVADAGGDITITTDEIATTTIMGYVIDVDNTQNFLQCAWGEGTNILGPSVDVGPNGECPLDLSTVSLGTGVYTMILYAADYEVLSTDEMVLTIVDPNNAPVADAGINITISTEEVATTIIQGTGTDADGDTLQCRWQEGIDILLDTPAGANGECPLDLSMFSFGLGTYSLFLTVDDGSASHSDETILTIDNSAPHAAPGGGGVYEINTDVILVGDASDFDGDSLSYQWIDGSSNVLCSGTIQTVAEGTPVMVPDCVASNLSLGLHTISLQVDDGINLPDSNIITVEIVDTTVPTISPVANNYILWPPNHQMVDIVIEANAGDNSGLPVTLSAAVASNEPQDGTGDGDTGPDWTAPSIDQNTGTINLQLRRERSGSGNGRVYTMTLTVTDQSGNSSITNIAFTVPHDKGKKK